MLNVTKILPGGHGLAPVLVRRAATVELDWDVRQKSRFGATDSQGRHVGVFLPRGTSVRGGDVLVADDGSLILVKAAPQTVLVITACREHGSPFDLTRAAYHLGNRHVPIELKPDHLKIEPDHVLADMLRAMHLIVREENSAFEPEGGAYGGHGASHGHAHTHANAHTHTQSTQPATPAASDTGFRPFSPAVLDDRAARGAAGSAHAHDPNHSHDHDGCGHAH